MIEQINKIILETAFPQRRCNPCCMIWMLPAWILFTGAFGLCMLQRTIPEMESIPSDVPIPLWFSISLLVVGLLVPYISYWVVYNSKKCTRKSRLLTFIREWNETKSNGVYLSFGGVGTKRSGKRGLKPVGSETGGTYAEFDLAVCDPVEAIVKGYLHVFVNYQARLLPCFTF